MTTSTKISIKPTWTPEKTQEMTARMASNSCMAANKVISQFGEKAMTEYQTAMRQGRVAALKEYGIKTPLDLAKALGESEANLFGSKIEVEGDEKSASLTYNFCGMWNAMQKYGNLSPEQQKEMGSGFQHCMQALTAEFGFKSDVCFADNNTCTINISK